MTIKDLDREIKVREQSREVYEGAYVALANRLKDDYLSPKIELNIGRGIMLSKVIRNLQPLVATLFAVQDKQFRRRKANDFTKTVTKKVSNEVIGYLRTGINNAIKKVNIQI